METKNGVNGHTSPETDVERKKTIFIPAFGALGRDMALWIEPGQIDVNIE